MIPHNTHNSRKFRAILDLSFILHLHGIEVTSVNDATNKAKSPTHAMGQLGQVLPRLIAKMAEATLTDGNIMFAKLDIKNGGYWREWWWQTVKNGILHMFFPNETQTTITTS
jgi:hypothetical protein